MDVKYILDNPEHVQEYMEGLMRDNAALREEIKDVEECLAECRKYAVHHHWCGWITGSCKCTCGYEAMMAELEETK